MNQKSGYGLNTFRTCWGLRHVSMLSTLALLALSLAIAMARAGDPDEDYLKIYGQVQDADALAASGRPAQAMAKYEQVLQALRSFQKTYPDWNSKVVNARASRVAAAMAALTTKPTPVASSSTNLPAGASSPARTESAATPALGKVKLLAAGAEPRQVLRLHPKVGDQQNLDLTMKLAMATKLGQQELPGMKLPAITFGLQVTVQKVSPEGDITYQMVLSDANLAEDPAVQPQLAEILKTSLGKAKGVAGTGRVSDRGVGTDVEVNLPSGAGQEGREVLDQMRQLFSGTILTLPEEPVGPGAKWEVNTINKAQGISIHETQSYELVSVAGDGLTAKMTLSERAANQKVQAPSGRVGTIELNKLTGNGTGELKCELSHLLPIEASATQHRDTTLTMGKGAQGHVVDQKMDLDIRLQPQAPAATPADTGAPQKH